MRGTRHRKNGVPLSDGVCGNVLTCRTGALVSATQTPPSIVRFTSTSFSMRVIAAAIILLFFYYAAGVVITLLFSILLAYFLDPAVEFLEKFRLPRTVGAMVMVLIFTAVMAAVGYGLWTRLSDFSADWPRYSSLLENVATAVQGKIQGIAGQVSQIAPTEGSAPGAGAPVGEGMMRALIFRGIGSLYALFLEITFMPFLVFFMLAEKRQVWHGTLQLFPASRRTPVKETLEDVRDVLRDYLAGMTLVTLLVIAMSSLFFWTLGMEFPILTGIVSGLLNMVPYIGVVLAWFPAFLIALAKWSNVGQFALIAAMLTTIHLLALNLLGQNLLARRVRLTPVALTLALLSWAWVGGGLGLGLAFPLLVLRGLAWVTPDPGKRDGGG